MLTIQTARSVLRDAGIRLTPQRLMIVEVLIGNRTHPTVEQVYDVVRKQYPTISLATVYKTLSLLAQNRLIIELQGGRDGLRYDPDTSLHAHAYCAQCHRILDIPVPFQVAWDEPQLTGFQPTQVEISLTGYCAQCHV